MSTLLAVLVLASEEAEPSKTPFYVVGGALAVFAVALGALGLASNDFPRSDGAMRGVLALAAVLTVGAMATAVITA